MAFEFGIFHEFQRRAGQADAEAFAQSFTQVDAAERWGLDVVWLPGIHFLPAPSGGAPPPSPSPAPTPPPPPPPHEGGHRRAGAAALPPVAVGGGGDDPRPHQPGSPHFWRG